MDKTYPEDSKTEETKLAPTMKTAGESKRTVKKARKQRQKPLCAVCYEYIELRQIVPLKCGHIFHPMCVRRHIRAKVDARSLPITCLDTDCREELASAELEFFCNNRLYERLIKLQKELLVLQKDFFWTECPTQGCKFTGEWSGVEDDSFIYCTDCKVWYCASCRVEFHYYNSCKEYRAINGLPEPDFGSTGARTFKHLVENHNGFQQCTNCKNIVEKSGGCDHITCLCGYEFCYKCGGKYRNCDC
ncbi:unnamed protein product [Moneuplotes crassus]|uniref:RING-type domain-containing protein n=1 Tax=Euplotes crassus TaxID=5936 RepID=A0AAD1XRB6_EUPCR|nr:unnamed protein product [Moneuplotes crassus]